MLGINRGLSARGGEYSKPGQGNPEFRREAPRITGENLNFWKCKKRESNDKLRGRFREEAFWGGSGDAQNES